jgi:hypothetical protein
MFRCPFFGEAKTSVKLQRLFIQWNARADIILKVFLRKITSVLL